MFSLSPLSWFGLICWIIALVSAVIWGHTFRHRQRDIVGNMRIYFGISLILLCVAGGSLATKGLNLGLDFTGGTILELGSEKMVTVDEVQSALNGFKSPELGDRMIQVGDVMQKDEEGKAYQRVVVRVTRAQATADGGKQLVDQEPILLEKHISSSLGNLKNLGTSSIGPTITGELRFHAFLALGIAMLVQAIYIFARFGMLWRFGIAADLAILHDVVIMIGLYSLAGRQMDSPFIAALMTVAGYSVMDSVVIFDRIRENDEYFKGKKPFAEIVNLSVNQTMTRSINTTLTVLITLVAIYFFGGSTLQNFAYALLVGITCGAYSSVFIAAPVLVLIDRYFKTTPKQQTAYTPAVSQQVDPVYQETGTDDAPKRRRTRGQRRKI